MGEIWTGHLADEVEAICIELACCNPDTKITKMELAELSSTCESKAVFESLFFCIRILLATATRIRRYEDYEDGIGTVRLTQKHKAKHKKQETFFRVCILRAIATRIRRWNDERHAH